MAEEITGALTQAQAAQPPQDAQQPAPLGNKDLIANYFAKVQAQDAAATTALNERRRRLLELTGARQQMFDPKMLRLSAALAKPTQTGSFGESLGNASAAMADEQEKEMARKQQELKLQMEIEQMMQSQGRQMLGNELAANIFANRQPPTAGGAPMSAPVAQPPAAAPVIPAAPVNNLPAATTKQTSPFIDGRSTGTLGALQTQPAAPVQAPAPVPAPAPEMSQAPAQQSFGLPPRKKGMFDDLDDDSAFALGLVSPDLAKQIEQNKENQRKARETQIKEAEYGLKEQSVKGVVPGVGDKEMPVDFWNQLRNAKSMDEIKSLYGKYRLPWDVVKEKDGTQRFKTPNEIELDKEEGKAKLTERPEKFTVPELGRGQFELLPSEYRDYRKAKSEGKDALQQWFNSSHPEFGVTVEGAKKVKPTGQATGVESSGERDIREAKEKKVGEQRAISEVKNRDEIINNAKAADRLQLPAMAIYNLAKDPVRGKALGLLEDPTVGDAFMGVVAQGAQVGSYNVGIPAIRDAVAKLSGNNKEEASKIMSSLQMLAKNFAIIELNLTRQYLQGEGAVTEGERAIVRNISGGVGTRRDVAMSQAEMFIQRAEFDRRVKQELLAWEKKNPNKSFDEFSESDNYKTLWNALNKNMDTIYNKYYGDKSNTKSSAKNSAAPSPVLGREVPANSTVRRPVWDPVKGDWK